MENYKFWDTLVSTASWLIVLALGLSVVNLFLIPPTGAGPVSQLVGVTGSQIFFSILYGSQAILLSLSKLFHWNGLRKRTLMFTYLTAFFTLLLSYMVSGMFIKLADNLIIAISSAICWLYWKFRTDYVEYEMLDEYVDD